MRPKAVFDTSMGQFTAELYSDLAPKTVENFVGLAEGTKAWRDPRSGEEVSRPFYNGLIFHRIIKDFMIQGGCPLGRGTGGPGYKFADEFHPQASHDGPGVLSMANSGANTNGSQFFVTHAATPWLDNKHSVFGKVVEGLDVVDRIAGVPTGAQDKPVNPVTINSITIVR